MNEILDFKERAFFVESKKKLIAKIEAHINEFPFERELEIMDEVRRMRGLKKYKGKLKEGVSLETVADQKDKSRIHQLVSEMDIIEKRKEEILVEALKLFANTPLKNWKIVVSDKENKKKGFVAEYKIDKNNDLRLSKGLSDNDMALLIINRTPEGMKSAIGRFGFRPRFDITSDEKINAASFGHFSKEQAEEIRRSMSDLGARLETGLSK